MHLLVPFASDDSEACRHVLNDLALPHLTRLLGRLTETARDDGEATSLSPPHERALAAARGWHGGDGALPFAAHSARLDGIDPGPLAWALVKPVHWLLGRDHVTMTDPAQLALSDAESRTFFDAVRGLFESEGFAAAWGAPDRWYVARADLDGFAAASPDRVIGRDVDRWLGKDRSPLGRLVQRLQSEAQLVLHAHPLNEEREERGDAVVNSLWLSGCGRAQATNAATEPQVEDSLRSPLLAGDWAAWAEAWQALDAGPIARLGTGDATLTLCGERSAARFETRPRGLVARLKSRWTAAPPHLILGGL